MAKINWVLLGQLAVEKSDLNFDVIDYRALGKYLAVHLTPEEVAKNNLISVIPTRSCKRS